MTPDHIDQDLPNEFSQNPVYTLSSNRMGARECWRQIPYVHLKWDFLKLWFTWESIPCHVDVHHFTGLLPKIYLGKVSTLLNIKDIDQMIRSSSFIENVSKKGSSRLDLSYCGLHIFIYLVICANWYILSFVQNALYHYLLRYNVCSGLFNLCSIHIYSWLKLNGGLLYITLVILILSEKHCSCYIFVLYICKPIVLAKRQDS